MCSENCIECPKFDYEISKQNLKHNILTDKWFSNLLIFFKGIIPAKNYKCPNEYKL